MNKFSYDPNLDSVKDRCHLIMLYAQANELRQSPTKFQEAREKADAALSAWLQKYGSDSNVLNPSVNLVRP